MSTFIGIRHGSGVTRKPAALAFYLEDPEGNRLEAYCVNGIHIHQLYAHTIHQIAQQVLKGEQYAN